MFTADEGQIWRTPGETNLLYKNMTWQTWRTDLTMAKKRWMIQHWKKTKKALMEVRQRWPGKQEDGPHLDLTMGRGRLMNEVWRTELIEAKD